MITSQLVGGDDVSFDDLDQHEIDRLFDEAVTAFWTERHERPAHTINVAKATAMLDLIETHPDWHEQDSWANLTDDVKVRFAQTIDQAKAMALGACGTTGCAAGWVAALDGHIVGTVGELEGVILDLVPKGGIVVRTSRWGPSYLDTDHDGGYDHQKHHVETYSRDALGLTQDQADDLFYGANSRERVRQLLSDWTYGEIPRFRPV